MAVLCYHSVDPDWASDLSVAPATFERQCAWLARNRSVVPLARFLQVRGPRRTRRLVALTFDDGFEALFHHALPALTRYRLPAMVFLVARTLVTGPAEADWLRPPERARPATLTRDQVAEMAEAGVEFASHSWAHHDLTRLSESECVRDLRESREVLEDILGRPVPYLAYPYGFHAPHVHRAAEKAGYAYALTLPEWGERRPPGPYAVPRVGIYRDNSLLALRTKSTRWYPALRTGPAVPALRRLAGRPRIPHGFLRAETRRLVARHPRLYLALISLTERRAARLDPHTTSLVVEGYPRSGNTFAVALLRTAFPGRAIASHLHASAHVKDALRHSVPAVVLVRDPLDAVASFSVREPGVPQSSMLRSYLDFYGSLLGERQRLVPVRFDELVKDPGTTVRQVAERLGIAPVPEVDAAFLARVANEVERMEREASGGVVDEQRVPRPSPERTAANDAARQRLTRDHPELLARCQVMYHRFLGI